MLAWRALPGNDLKSFGIIIWLMMTNQLNSPIDVPFWYDSELKEALEEATHLDTFPPSSMSTSPTQTRRAEAFPSTPSLPTSPARSPGDPSLVDRDSLPQPEDAPQANTNTAPAPDGAAPPVVCKALCYETLTTNSIFGLPTAQKLHLVRRFRERYAARSHQQFRTKPRPRTHREERNARILMSYDVATQYFEDLYNAQVLATAQATIAAAAVAAAAEQAAQQAADHAEAAMLAAQQAAQQAQGTAEGVAPGQHQRAGNEVDSDDEVPPLIPPRVFSLPDEYIGPLDAAGWDDDDDDDDNDLYFEAFSAAASGNSASEASMPTGPSRSAPSASSYLLRVWSRLGFNSFFPRPFTETETVDDMEQETAEDDTVEAAAAAARAAGDKPFHVIKMLSMYGAKHVFCRCTDGRHREHERREAYAFHGFDGAVVIKRARTSVLPME
ncbi:hypothetical protein R3P38DRAFT_3195605 [Favolaschia claudopus]|uniref:Uncharacterized protein n=1 Tax=Favolaschia claudopus TaxID=2862362 RepID=A0AAW0B855_9AGAR